MNDGQNDRKEIYEYRFYIEDYSRSILLATTGSYHHNINYTNVDPVLEYLYLSLSFYMYTRSLFERYDYCVLNLN